VRAILHHAIGRQDRFGNINKCPVYRRFWQIFALMVVHVRSCDTRRKTVWFQVRVLAGPPMTQRLTSFHSRSSDFKRSSDSIRSTLDLRGGKTRRSSRQNGRKALATKRGRKRDPNVLDFVFKFRERHARSPVSPKCALRFRGSIKQLSLGDDTAGDTSLSAAVFRVVAVVVSAFVYHQRTASHIGHLESLHGYGLIDLTAACR
jgi:hypothetical protein